MRPIYVVWCSVAAILGVESSAIAQSDCGAVYANATSNVSSSTISRARDRNWFLNYCENTGVLKRGMTEAGIAAVSGGFFGEFRGSRSEALSYAQRICSEQSGVANDVDYNSSWQYQVAVDALRSYNECRALEVIGIRVSHTIDSAGNVSIFFSFDATRVNVEFQGITYSGTGARCTSTGFSTEENGVSPVVDVTSTTPGQRMTRPFTIICQRSEGSGVRPGNPFSVTVATNHGSYSASVFSRPQGDGVCESLLRASESSNADLQKKLASTKLEMDLATRALADATGNIRLVVAGQNDLLPGAVHFSCSRTRDDVFRYAMQVCGSGQVHGFQRVGARRGGACGYTYYVFSCRPR